MEGVILGERQFNLVESTNLNQDVSRAVAENSSTAVAPARKRRTRRRAINLHSFARFPQEWGRFATVFRIDCAACAWSTPAPQCLLTQTASFTMRRHAKWCIWEHAQALEQRGERNTAIDPPITRVRAPAMMATGLAPLSCVASLFSTRAAQHPEAPSVPLRELSAFGHNAGVTSRPAQGT